MSRAVIDPADELAAELCDRLERAAGRAASRGAPVLASVTFPVGAELDIAACVFASRGAEERYFIWEEPGRDSFALGALGAAYTVEGGPAVDRFRWAAARCSELIQGGLFDDPAGDPLAPHGSGPVWLGGFAFAPHGCRSPEWRSLPTTLLTLPEISIARHGDAARVTVNVVVRPADDVEELARGALTRLGALRVAPMPLADPDRLAGQTIVSGAPPEAYEQSVEESARRIVADELEKVVLAREVVVESPTPFHPGVVFDGLRTTYPSCFCFCVGTPEATFVGASPEVLLRREGERASTVAMAGSTRRSADPRVDDHLGERLLQSAKDLEEHAIVVRTIERSLRPYSVWVTAPDQPVLIKVANIQHLATPIRALLAEPHSVVEIAGALHPTAAVGGEPWEAAQRVIGELETIDRGWYAGPVGWMDATEDGEFCVALRCALLQGRTARCYAGVGIVGESRGDAELAETEVKLQALLSVLSGS